MIVTNCQTTRQTFYRYFHDKFDLINWIFCNNIEQVLNSSSEKQPWSMVLGDMLQSMKNDQNFYVNAINYEGQNSFYQIIANCTRIAYAKELTKRLDSKYLSKDILLSIEFNSHGAVGLIYDWIKSNMKDDPYKLAQSIADNMPQSMKRYFQ